MTDLREVGKFPASCTRARLLKALEQKYPQFKWESLFVLRGRYAQQKRLEREISSIFGPV